MMQGEKLPRRRFLKITAVVVGGAVAAAAGTWAFLAGEEDDDRVRDTDFGPLLVFNRARAATLGAFADTILPAGDRFPSAGEARVVHRLDEELYFVSPPIRSDFKTVLDVFDLLPLAYGYFSTFTGLDRGDRLRFLAETQKTRSDTVRIVVASLRMAVMMMYYGHESSWSAIGYDGPYEKSLEPVASAQRDHYARKIRAPGRDT